ncbi:MAG: right-handed parallel beta-helix repeat-containing protein [Methylocella sp.]
MTRHFATHLSLVATLAISAAPAQALSSRVFVSGHGTDSTGCGAVTAPCRTFQFAHNNTGAGGTIIVRNSGDYGPVHITKSISIVNDGAGTASVRAKTDGTDCILIDGLGPADVVHLRGLSITGSGPGYGVEASNVGSLTIINCVVRGFRNGIFIDGNDGPTSFSISHTMVAENNENGIFITTFKAGSAVGVIDHVLAYHNSDDGVILADNVKATVIDSVLSNNSYNLYVGGSGLTAFSGASATVRNVTASYNHCPGFDSSDVTPAGYGFYFALGSFSNSASGIAHSVVTGNDYGFGVVGNVVETYGDNDHRLRFRKGN